MPRSAPVVDKSRKFGVKLVGEIPWGTHLCQFYESKQDLIDILVPYFTEGLRSNEFCMWVTSPPLEVAEAKAALAKSVTNLEAYIQKGQIEIVSYNDWYLLGGKFDANRSCKDGFRKKLTRLNVASLVCALPEIPSGSNENYGRNLWITKPL